MSSSKTEIYATLIKDSSSWTIKERIIRSCVDCLFIVLLFIMLIRCHEIPFKRVDLDIETKGPQKTLIDAVAILGTDTHLRSSVDSDFIEDFRPSGGFGCQLNIHASDTTKLFARTLPMEDKEEILKYFPNDPMVDSLNSTITASFNIRYKNSRFGWLAPSKRTTDRVWDNESKRQSICYVGRGGKIHSEKKHLLLRDCILEGSTKIAFKDELIYKIVPFQVNLKSDESIWKFCDISQAYVGVTLNNTLFTASNSDPKMENTEYATENNLSLTLDFGSPISVSEMYPEPDVVSMHSIYFNEAWKIKYIEDNNLVFHVKFVHNDNIQSVKMFWITTMIALFISLFVNNIIKIFLCKLRRKKGLDAAKEDEEDEN